MSVSVVICAHNEAHNLSRNLPFILQQKYNDFEVIVVNDRSSDSTNDVLNRNEFKRVKVINIQFCDAQLSPKKMALEKGIAEASGDFILLTDADCKPVSMYWIAKMTSVINQKTDVVLGYSPYKEHKQNKWLNALVGFDTFFTALQYFSFAIAKQPFMGVGRNLLLRKSSFVNVDGFEGFREILMGDDDVIVQKISDAYNTEVCLHPESFIKSKPKQKWEDWFSQKRRHLSVGVHYKPIHQWRVGLFQQSYAILYLSTIILCFLSFNLKLSLILLFLLLKRALFFYGINRKKFNFKVSIYFLPFLDLLYFFNYLLIGISVIIRKKRKWH